MHFIELKKNLKKDFSGLKSAKIALLGDSSTQHFTHAIRGYGYEAGFDLEVFEASYDQIHRQIMYGTSEMYQFHPEYIVLFQSVQKLKKRFYKTELKKRSGFALDEITRIRVFIEEISKHAQGVKVLICNFMELNDSVFGQYANKTDTSFLFQIRYLNFQLMALAVEAKNIFICDFSALTAAFGHNYIIDNRNYVNADMVFSIDFLPEIAKAVVENIKVLSGFAKKCLVLDLDNTIWGGVIGDDGIENIQVGDLGYGKAFSELQCWAKELQRRGVLLAICSKNDEEIAKSPFLSHPEMVLRLDDIAIFMANWESKVDNLKKIKKFLNIGFDSIVFIDDNPYERGVVKRHLPEITVPELPEDPADYLCFLSGLNLFETSAYTSEDGQRTLHFQQELKRESIQASFTDERGFLKSLGMKCEIRSFSAFNLPRVAQLLQRSNQFNLRTIRYTEEDLRRLCTSDVHLNWTFSLNDQFGSYGLISVVIGYLYGDEFFIDTWVMSCRVLNRGVQNLALNEIVQGAKRLGAKRICGEYISTPKNGLVKNHYHSLGFTENNGGRWILDVEVYQEFEHCIEII
ncbi:HAD-IIIC family phosphatase [Methylomonas albis]|uniref:HAD family hydrolase n=1 Tax=Methylomonas albis TaxID=1854563 RepID=A0ABR9D1N4_9GAMM|nr:HAD-IIIC family phosphatase [Methylomonas albis]MBD9356726.1 HAD family hydrolase [Methylomonas albis]